MRWLASTLSRKSMSEVNGTTVATSEMANPRQRVVVMRTRCEQLSHRLGTALGSTVREKRRWLQDAARLLNDLSPLAVLDRGYSLVMDAHGEIVRDARAVTPGEMIRIKLSRGIADAEIKKTTADEIGYGK